MTTDLARAWEAEPELRRKAQKLELVRGLLASCKRACVTLDALINPFLHAKVQSTGRSVCRDTICQNDKAVLHACRLVGSHVAVQTLEVHIKALYDYMKLGIESHLGSTF